MREKRMTRDEKKTADYNMLYLFSCAINKKVPEKQKTASMDLESIYQSCCRHKIITSVFTAIEPVCDVFPAKELLSKWKEAKNMAIRKNILLDTALDELSLFMEKNHIWFLPLKGSIIKDLYPEYGMREMSDNDVLFDATYRANVKEWFLNHGYSIEIYGEGNHDVYYKAPVLNFEMHTELFSKSYNAEVYDYYLNLSDRLIPDDKMEYGYKFTDEDFYIYMTVHEYKHFSKGGTGVRSLADRYVFVTSKGNCLDMRYIKKELTKLGIDTFEEKIKSLSEKVFSDPDGFDYENLSKEETDLLEYYLSSGAYGTTVHVISNELKRRAKNDKILIHIRLKYIMSRAFPSADYIKKWCNACCPFLSKRTCFLPIAYIYRLVHATVKRTYSILKELEIIWKT